MRFSSCRVLRTNMQTVQLCANPLHKCSGDDDEEPVNVELAMSGLWARLSTKGHEESQSDDGHAEFL